MSAQSASSERTHRRYGRSGGLAAWASRHPIGVSMIALAIVVLGAAATQRLGVNLLPHLIYPGIGVRIVDPGVPATVMEDLTTRQLEEQLAITEDAIGVRSRSIEGRASVDLTFPYGKDIDVALRDASSRLDRAKRFLPESIDPPIIFKRDPSQIPALEFAVSSSLREPVALRTWVDYTFSKWFLNLPGVAAVEVGGASEREIHVLPDQQRLEALGVTLLAIENALETGNVEAAGGPLRMARQELNSRTSGRFREIEDIAHLPISVDSNGRVVRLRDVAEVVDSHSDEKLRVRLNGEPGLKVSVQKQPQANTIAVLDSVKGQLDWLRAEQLIPGDIKVDVVADQSLYVRQALINAVIAAVSGAVLAMLVVYFFLGDVRRMLIIGTGIPLGVMVALMLLAMFGLTLNIMTLGGLALGVGLLVDNTIVMQENIVRHQRRGERALEAARLAAVEVNSAIVASTSTNLAAVLPFLFVGGLVGLLFKELIVTISAAIVASSLVALTLVPALSSRVSVSAHARGWWPERITERMEGWYARLLDWLLRPLFMVIVLVGFLLALAWAVPIFFKDKQIFLPEIDDGRASARLVADAGISLDEMDAMVERIEQLFLAQPEVQTTFSQVGGFVFGRSQHEFSNRARVAVQLVPADQRALDNSEWVANMRKEVSKLELVGLRVRLRNDGIRGIRLSTGDDKISLRIQGDDLRVLTGLGDQLVAGLESLDGLVNERHSAEDIAQELSVIVDRERASAMGLTVASVSRAVRIALQGVVVTDFIDGDQQFDVRLRLPIGTLRAPGDVERILLFPSGEGQRPTYLGEVARVDLVDAPAEIRRDRQQRIVEVSASLDDGFTLGEALAAIEGVIAALELPDGYSIYDGGASEALNQGKQLAGVLLGLALFLVLVVMAVQYESLRNPVIILLGVPFSLIGVALALVWFDIPISMPLWLGMIMLTGIVVNNAIVLVEYVELAREKGRSKRAALVEAGRLRLRPILMTTITTAVGMLPLAIGIGEGAEMLKPLAITVVCGLSFSMLVTLLVIPAVYLMLGRRDARAGRLETA
ncbi:MAG: efflux RND transporter permease subunit [Pseudomonadota bacterium]